MGTQRTDNRVVETYRYFATPGDCIEGTDQERGLGRIVPGEGKPGVAGKRTDR